MKVLLAKSVLCTSEEGGSGCPEYAELPCQLVLSSQYISDLGFDVTMKDIFEEEENAIQYEQYDVTVAWVPILGERFYKGVEILQRAKKQGSTTVMVLNDSLEGMEKECLDKFPYIDFAIRLYEREIVLGQLLTRIKENRSCNDLKGIMFRAEGKIVDNGLHPWAENLHHLKAADTFLRQLPLERYAVGKIEVARGCPYQCIFCFYGNTKRRVRRIEDIIKELKVMDGLYTITWLHELNMMIDKDFTRDLSQAIIDAGIRVNWATDARMAGCLDMDLLQIMKKSGCSMLNFGMECVDEKIRNEKIKKNVSDKIIEQAIENCLKAGIIPSVNLMLGTPWESRETMIKTQEFMKKFPYVNNVQLARPQTGTPLYNEFKNEGLLDKDLHIEDYIDPRDYPVCATKYLSREELYKWYWKFTVKIISKHSVERLKALGAKRLFMQIWHKKKKLYYIKVMGTVVKEHVLGIK